MKVTITTIFLWTMTVLITSAAEGSGSYELADPSKSLFGSETKVVKGFYTAEWMIKGSAALFSIGCFITSGNLARQGHYGRAAGAAIGGVISSLGAYLVGTSQAAGG